MNSSQLREASLKKGTTILARKTTAAIGARPESYSSCTPPKTVKGSTSPATVIVITGSTLAGT
jgi:hypothetical protein